jgi:hypothetical protein
MTADEIIQRVLTDNQVYLHYTDGSGLQRILAEGVIRMNEKYAVYLTQEPLTQAEAHMNLFIGATTHAGRGSHILVLRVDSGVPVERVGYLEYCVRQTLRLDQHMVLYAGPNPF